MNYLKRSKLILIVIILLLITTLIIMDTYALFETDAESTAELTVGAWKIYINNNDLSVNETITLDDFSYTNGVHTESGYFAPGSSGVFDIIIDTSESDVSVAYDLVIDDSALDDHPNISFSIMNVTANQVLTSNEFSGVINLNDASRVVTLRVSISWANVLANDPDDSALIGGELEFPIEAHFIQYTGQS